MKYELFRRVPLNCGIWKKLKPVVTNKWLSLLLHSYLDENTKNRPSNWVSNQSDLSDSERRNLVAKGRSRLIAGTDYSAFDEGIWTFGHIASQLANRGVKTPIAKNKNGIEALADWWVRDRHESAVKAHHIVASFDGRITSELHRIGYPVDAMLLSSFHHTMSKYGARFYPSDTLGWIAGCHHDSAHVHIHALVHPTTSSGKLLRLSGLRDGEVGEDKFDFIRTSFNTRSRQLFVATTQQIEAPKEVDELTFNHWLLLSRHAMLSVDRTKPEATYLAAEKYSLLVDSRSYDQALNEASKEVETSFAIGTPSSPDLGGLESSWDAIIGSLNERRQNHYDTAIEVFKKHNSKEQYAPSFSSFQRPTPPPLHEYAAFASITSSTRVKELNDVLMARKSVSMDIRTEFNEALEKYQISVDQSRRDMDAIMVKTGFALSLIALETSMMKGVKPSYKKYTNDDNKTPKLLQPDAHKEAFAELEMAKLAASESKSHQPEDANLTPSIHACAYSPRFRELLVPQRNLCDISHSL